MLSEEDPFCVLLEVAPGELLHFLILFLDQRSFLLFIKTGYTCEGEEISNDDITQCQKLKRCI